jgi:hypothetical protein
MADAVAELKASDLPPPRDMEITDLLTRPLLLASSTAHWIPAMMFEVVPEPRALSTFTPMILIFLAYRM